MSVDGSEGSTQAGAAPVLLFIKEEGKNKNGYEIINSGESASGDHAQCAA